MSYVKVIQNKLKTIKSSKTLEIGFKNVFLYNKNIANIKNRIS